MSSIQQGTLAARHCVYCGKPVATNQSQCPHCREAVPKVRLAPAAPAPAAKRSQMLRGILYMLLALVIHYVAVRSDSLNLPFSVNPAVSYLATMMFLAGLALTLYGFLTKVTA
jgi:hypothetical protein